MSQWIRIRRVNLERLEYIFWNNHSVYRAEKRADQREMWKNMDFLWSGTTILELLFIELEKDIEQRIKSSLYCVFDSLSGEPQ